MAQSRSRAPTAVCDSVRRTATTHPLQIACANAKTRGLVFETQFRTDVLEEQRGLEEILDVTNPQARAAQGGLNRERAINLQNPNADLYREAARHFLRRWVGE
jgi:hypothetical protein